MDRSPALLLLSLLPLAALVFASSSSSSPPPTVAGQWRDASGLKLPDSKLPAVPIVGNGYLGVALGSRCGDARHPSPPAYAGPGSSYGLDFWLNTNANWGCAKAPAGSMPPVPAVCAVKALGGVSLSFNTSAGDIAESVSAEQSIASGTITGALHAAGRRGDLSAVAVVHPSKNVLLLNVSWRGAGNANVTLSTWALHGGYTAAVSTGGNSAQAAGVVSRMLAANVSAAAASPFRVMWSALATRVAAAPRPPAAPVRVVQNENNVAQASRTVTLKNGEALSLIVALADNLLIAGSNNALDPSANASALAASVSASSITLAAQEELQSFFAASSVSLPTQPAIENFWFGAQFFTRAMTAPKSVVDANGGLLPPSGLYGPWATSDSPAWNGDYTLDYNQEAQYYGVFSSNHPELAAAYFRPITDWEPHAQAWAQRAASLAGITCDSTALRYSCHLAPWGYQSQDQSTYMNWNGYFAALLFINAWEYTRDPGFAKSQTLPLLRGLNEWSHCYLARAKNSSSSPSSSDYILNDYRAGLPDEEHENQKVVNPQIGISLMRRAAEAHAEIASSLGLPVPDHVKEIVQHLAPPNVGAGSNFFALHNETRCTGDYHLSTSEASVDECEASCRSDNTCGAFSFCAAGGPVAPPVGNCPKGNSCFRFHSNSSCSNSSSGSSAHGFTSGFRQTEQPIWTAFENATQKQSDSFALYPLWPSETVDAIDTVTASPATRSIAAASVQQWADFGGRPVLVFPAAVRGGGSPANMAVVRGRSAEEIVAGLNAMLAKLEGPCPGRPYAPGGGTENMGVTQAVNDMLVQAPGGRYIALFPVWPAAEPAAFSSLRTKGGFLVSATWNNATQAVDDGISITATAPDCKECVLQDPFGTAANPSKAVPVVTCSGGSQQRKATRVAPDHIRWSMKPGDTCVVARAAELHM